MNVLSFTKCRKMLFFISTTVCNVFKDMNNCSNIVRFVCVFRHDMTREMQDLRNISRDRQHKISELNAVSL